jgi:hypothetical protein
MTKRQGSSNYNASEMACLLELVKSHLPASKKDWEHVAAAYNATKEPGWKPRDAVSLTRKYRSMCMASSQFDTERAGSIRRVQALLEKHTTSPKRAANPTSAAAIPGSTSGPAAAITSFDAVPASSLPCRRAFLGSAVDKVRLQRVEERAVLRRDCEGSGAVTISQRLQTLLQQLTTDQGEAHRNHQDIIQGITSLKVTLDCLVAQTNSIYQQQQ